MDASCKIQGSIHVFRLVNNMCPGKWVHIIYPVAFTCNIVLTVTVEDGVFNKYIVYFADCL